jgi:hypothetical protein
VGTLAKGWFRAALVAWLPVSVVATVLAGTSYATTQQVTRSSVDDAPRALAQRAADTLSRGGKPSALTPGPPVDLATDLGPFLMVFGPQGGVRASSAQLDGLLPVIPPGVLAEARQHGVDQVTWQPRAGVREAVIAMPWHSATTAGVVVAGASLGPAEARVDRLTLFVFAGWLVAMIGSLALACAGAMWLGWFGSGTTLDVQGGH